MESPPNSLNRSGDGGATKKLERNGRNTRRTRGGAKKKSWHAGEAKGIQPPQRDVPERVTMFLMLRDSQLGRWKDIGAKGLGGLVGPGNQRGSQKISPCDTSGTRTRASLQTGEHGWDSGAQKNSGEFSQGHGGEGESPCPQ